MGYQIVKSILKLAPPLVSLSKSEAGETKLRSTIPVPNKFVRPMSVYATALVCRGNEEEQLPLLH